MSRRYPMSSLSHDFPLSRKQKKAQETTYPKSWKLTVGDLVDRPAPTLGINFRLAPLWRSIVHKHANKMLSNAIEALYIFDQHKFVSLLMSSFLSLMLTCAQRIDPRTCLPLQASFSPSRPSPLPRPSRTSTLLDLSSKSPSTHRPLLRHS